MPSRWTLRLAVVVVIVAGIGGAAAMGAFSTVMADRDVTISVATDENALLGLRDGHPGSGLVEQETDGTLSIRFDRHGGEGVNRDVTVTLGDAANPASTHAFLVDNDGNQPRTVDLEFQPAPGFTDGDTGTRNAVFTFHIDRDGDGSIENTVEISETSGDRTASIADVTTTDVIYVTVRIDTVGLGGNSDLSGSLHISAGG